MIARGKVLFAGKFDSMTRDIIDRLEKEGHHCYQAIDRNNAISFLRKTIVDVFVTELEFDGRPDMQVIRSIDSINKGVPVILITGNPSVETAAEAVRLSLAAYLIKPYEGEELYELMVGCISGNQARRTCSDMMDRMEKWTSDMASLERYLNSGVGSPVKFNMQNFVPLTIGRVLGAVLDLKALLDIAANKRGEHDVCHMLSCPRLNAFQEMTHDTIVTLEKTKNYFKSRDLHELRLRLEQFLKDQKN